MIATISSAIRDTLQFLNKNDGSLSRKTIRSAVWVAMSNIGLAGLGIVRTVILARLLLPQAFGLMSIVAMVQRAVEIFTETGLGAALVHRQTRVEEARHTVFTLLVIRGLVVAGLVVLAAPFVADYFDEPVLGPCIQVMAIGFLAIGFTNTNMELYRRELNFKTLTYIAQAQAVISLVIVAALAYVMRNVWALVIGQVLTILVGVILSYTMLEGRPRFFVDKDLAKELLRYGRFITGVAIFGFFSEYIDNAVVGKLLGMEALGFYVIAFKLASLPATHFSRVTARMMFPVCSKLQNDLAAMRDMYEKVVQFVGHLAIPMAVAMGVLAHEIVYMLYGQKWLSAVAPLQVLCVYGGVMALGSWGYVFNALGKPEINFYLNVGRAIGIGTLIYPMTKMFGLTGAAWAVALPMLVHFVVQVVVISRVLALERWHLMTIVGDIVRNSLVMAVVLLLVKQLHIADPYLSFAAAAAVGGLTYVALNRKAIRNWRTLWNGLSAL